MHKRGMVPAQRACLSYLMSTGTYIFESGWGLGVSTGVAVGVGVLVGVFVGVAVGVGVGVLVGVESVHVGMVTDATLLCSDSNKIPALSRKAETVNEYVVLSSTSIF